MSTLAPERHHVVIGHTAFLPEPLPVSQAKCCGDNGWCEFCATGDHIRRDGVRHAQETGHGVMVGQGRTVTFIEVTD